MLYAMVSYLTPAITAAKATESCILGVNNAIENGVGLVINKSHSYASSATAKTVRFVRENYVQIFAYILAWGVIVACSGTLYGFEAVALPLTIGFGCGLGVGGIIGILMTTAIDPRNKWRGYNTGWDLINSGVEKLDPHGTRQIVLAISVTVLLAACVIFPYALGAVFGILVGNQVATKVGQGRNLGQELSDEERHLRTLKSGIDNLRSRLANQVRRGGENDQTRELSARIGQLAQIQQQLQEQVELGKNIVKVDNQIKALGESSNA
ncbi:MAG: hypothetical protein S4CHLAM2_18040 [Chlamydiales bacterium]|nr:hypothetical protein [Chlamydiales bacterium]